MRYISLLILFLYLNAPAFAYESKSDECLAPTFSREVRQQALELLAKALKLPSRNNIFITQAGPADKAKIAHMLVQESNKMALDTILTVLRMKKDKRRDLFLGKFADLLKMDYDIASVAKLLPEFFEQTEEGEKIGQWVLGRDDMNQFLLVLPILHLDPKDRESKIVVRNKVYDYGIEIFPFIIDGELLEKQYQIPQDGPNLIRNLEEELLYGALTQLHIMTAALDMHPIVLINTPEYWDMTRLLHSLKVPMDENLVVKDILFPFKGEFSGTVIRPEGNEEVSLITDKAAIREKKEVIAFLYDEATKETFLLQKPTDDATKDSHNPESVLFYSDPNTGKSYTGRMDLFDAINQSHQKNFNSLMVIKVPYYMEDQLRNSRGRRQVIARGNKLTVSYDKLINMLRIPYALRENGNVGVNTQIVKWMREKIPLIHKDNPQGAESLIAFLQMITALAPLGEISEIVSHRGKLGAFIQAVMGIPVEDRSLGQLKRIAQKIKNSDRASYDVPNKHDRMFKLFASGIKPESLSMRFVSPQSADFNDIMNQLVEIHYATKDSIVPEFPTRGMKRSEDPALYDRLTELGFDMDLPEPGRKFVKEYLLDANKLTILLEGELTKETEEKYVGKKRLIGAVTITINHPPDEELRNGFAEKIAELYTHIQHNTTPKEVEGIIESFMRDMENSSYVGSLVLLPQLKGPGMYLWYMAAFTTAFLGRDPETGAILNRTYFESMVPPIAHITPETVIKPTTASLVQGTQRQTGESIPMVRVREPYPTTMEANVVQLGEKENPANNEMVITVSMQGIDYDSMVEHFKTIQKDLPDFKGQEEMKVTIQANALGNDDLRDFIDDLQQRDIFNMDGSRLSANLSRDGKKVKIFYHGESHFFSYSISENPRLYGEIGSGISSMLKLMPDLKRILAKVLFSARAGDSRFLKIPSVKLNEAFLRLISTQRQQGHLLFHPPLKELPSSGAHDAIGDAA